MFRVGAGAEALRGLAHVLVLGHCLEESLHAVCRDILAVGRVTRHVALQVAPQHDHRGSHVEELHAEHPPPRRALDDACCALLVARLPSLQVERRLEPRAHRADDGDARPRARLLGQHGGGHGARTHRGAPLYGGVARLEGRGLGVGRALPLVEMRALAQRGLVRSGQAWGEGEGEGEG